MTDKEKILTAIQKRMEFQKTCIKNGYRLTGKAEEEIIFEYQKLINFIDSIQEKPVSEEFEKALAEEWQGYVDRGAATVDALEDNTQELAFAKGFYRGANWQKQKSAEALNQNALLYDARLKGIEIGKAEMKQQMMKDAVDGVVHHLEKCGVASVHYTDPIGAPMAYYISPEGLSAGDKVKIIVIKEN